MAGSTPAGIRSQYKIAFVKGIGAILPLVLTTWVLQKVYRFVADDVAAPINAAIKARLLVDPAREPASRVLGIDPSWLAEGFEVEFSRAMDQAFPDWVGFAIAVAFCFLLGFFLRSFVGGWVWKTLEGWLHRLPVLKSVYPLAKQITEFFVKDPTDENQFSRVGFVPYPLEGQWSVGFVMADGFRELDDATGERHLSVFIPMAPTPVTGFVVLVPESKFRAIDMSVDEAFKYYVTAGLAIPDRHRAVPVGPGNSPGPPALPEPSPAPVPAG